MSEKLDLEAIEERVERARRSSKNRLMIRESSDVNGLVEHNIPALLQCVQEMRDAFQTIRRDYGQVCGAYDICSHASCHASCASWQLADKVLSEWFGEDGDDGL